MARHSETAYRSRRSHVRIAGLCFLSLSFGVGIWMSISFMRVFAEVPYVQSAAVAQSFGFENPYARMSLVAQSAIVVDSESGEMFYERNADAQLPLASLTKVALVLAVSEVLSPEMLIQIPADTMPNSNAGSLLTGERWRVRDLIAYTLSASSNDGANILAHSAEDGLRARYGNSVESAVVRRMNDIAKTLHLQTMYFLNATGLDISDTQSGTYGSARDVAALFSFASRYPDLFSSTATSSLVITSEGFRTIRITNTDTAIESYPGVLMGKTGYTNLAGGNLALVFENNGKRFVAVILGSTQEGRFSDMRQLVAATIMKSAH